MTWDDPISNDILNAQFFYRDNSDDELRWSKQVSFFVGTETQPITSEIFDCEENRFQSLDERIGYVLKHIDYIENNYTFLSDSKVTHVAFLDDCQEVDPPIPHPWSSPFTDEWNVFHNWHSLKDNIQAQEIWNKRKIPLADALERLRKEKPKALKPKVDFKVPQRIYDEIKVFSEEKSKILAKIGNADPNDSISLTNVNRSLKAYYALLACKTLMTMFGGHHPPYVAAVDTNDGYELVTVRGYYDNWSELHTFLKERFNIADWENHRDYDNFPKATWDVSNLPEFKDSEQKIFQIKVEFQDDDY